MDLSLLPPLISLPAPHLFHNRNVGEQRAVSCILHILDRATHVEDQ
jgi:hypothetical protein